MPTYPRFAASTSTCDLITTTLQPRRQHTTSPPSPEPPRSAPPKSSSSPRYSHRTPIRLSHSPCSPHCNLTVLYALQIPIPFPAFPLPHRLTFFPQTPNAPRAAPFPPRPNPHQYQQIRYDSSVTHPVFFTSRLGKPGLAAAGGVAPAGSSSSEWSPVAQGYLLRKEDGGVKL